MNKYKSIDLFAGIGGIRLGFEKAFNNEITTVFVSELDINAQKTYIANFKDTFSIAGDITAIDEKDIPSFDIRLPRKIRIKIFYEWGSAPNPAIFYKKLSKI